MYSTELEVLPLDLNIRNLREEIVMHCVLEVLLLSKSSNSRRWLVGLFTIQMPETAHYILGTEDINKVLDYMSMQRTLNQEPAMTRRVMKHRQSWGARMCKQHKTVFYSTWTKIAIIMFASMGFLQNIQNDISVEIQKTIRDKSMIC